MIPAAKVLATLPFTSDRVVLHSLDLDEELKTIEGDYLFVASSPPCVATVGQALKYQLDVRSSKGNVTFNLDAGPDGMTLSKTGLMRWSVRKPPEGNTTSVIISVSDASGQTLYHSFHLEVDSSKKKNAAEQPPTPED